MVTAMPGPSLLAWAARAVGDRAVLSQVEAKGSHGGGSPWLLRFDVHDGSVAMILRTVIPGWIGHEQIETGAVALQVAFDLGLPVPRLIASDLTGAEAGEPASLETVLPGSSAIPVHASTDRLRSMGAAIAAVHAHPLEATRELPHRIRPIEVDDYARERRWANAYRAATGPERSRVVDAYAALTGSSPVHAVELLATVTSTAQLQLADELVRRHRPPVETTVLVHGDIWAGNTLWISDECVALIDWKTAGVGHPGIDLGELRLQMALEYGPSAPEHVLEGWQHAIGTAASDLPYWDAVAALNTPTDLTGWPGFDDDGRPLSAGDVTARRDAFLASALDGIGG